MGKASSSLCPSDGGGRDPDKDRGVGEGPLAASSVSGAGGTGPGARMPGGGGTMGRKASRAQVCGRNGRWGQA